MRHTEEAKEKIRRAHLGMKNSPEARAKIAEAWARYRAIPWWSDQRSIDRFWGRVDRSGACWLWTGSRKSNGYGEVGLKGAHLYTHRVAWILTNGPIYDGLFVLHSCDNPPCVNPGHLSLGTHEENMRQRDARGRVRVS